MSVSLIHLRIFSEIWRRLYNRKCSVFKPSHLVKIEPKISKRYHLT